MKQIGKRISLATMLMAAVVNVASARSPDSQAVRDVITRIEANDCPGAVRVLNEGLIQGYSNVALLAGSMYDDGICVKRNWNRAMKFYVKAHEGGEKIALDRLISGFAAPSGGPDMAAALWWAHRKYPNKVEDQRCTVPENVRNDPDAFVAELAKWPRPRLEACNYVIGVLATLAGDTEYPETALRFGIAGTVTLRFTPAVPRIDVIKGSTEEVQIYGVNNSNVMDERKSRKVTGTFGDTMRTGAERALKRFPQPAGIDPAWEFDLEFVFEK